MMRQMRVLSQMRSHLIIGIGTGVLLIIMLTAGVLKSAQLSISNIYYVGAPSSERVVIVALDDTSLAAYGRSPGTWSRTLYADLIRELHGANARVIAFDIIFSESEAEDTDIIDAIEFARQSPQRTRFVLAVAGTESLPIRSGLAEYPSGIRMNSVLQPNEVLRRATDYIGFVNSFPDVDSNIRRQPSIIDFDGDFALSFSITVYLAYLRIPPSAFPQVINTEDSITSITPQRRLPVDGFGFWLNDFFSTPGLESASSFPIISFRDVIEGQADLSIFDDKIVLVGLINAVGATDRYLVPSSTNGQPMAGVEIHANAIETLLQDKALVEQSRLSEIVMIILASVAVSIGGGYPRWYFKILIWIGSILLAAIVSSLIFAQGRIVVNLLYLWLALSLPMLFAIGVEISQEISRRLRSEFLLESVTQVEQQRLLLGKIWPLIAQDIRQLMPDAKGAILQLSDGESTIIESIHATKSDLQPIAWQAYQTAKIIHQGRQHAIPIIWQNKIYGIIALETSRRHDFVRITVEDLAKRIAPSIENAVLYQQTRQQQEIQAAIFANIPEAIIVVDNQLSAIQWNTAFDKLVVKPIALNQDLIEILESNDIPEQALEALKVKFTLGEIIRDELGIRGQTFNLTAAPFQGSSGWVVILADVTKIAELSQLKTQMIRMASHDLKNPLSRVIGYAELIDMGKTLDERNNQFISHISNAGNEMLEIITKILDLEQLRSKEAHKESLDFARLVREVYARFEPDFTRKAQTHHLQIQPSTIMINGNYQQLSQVVANLLSNANKYTDDGGDILLNIRIDGQKMLMTVRDNGYGIPYEAQSKLFTEFYRVQTRQTANISGTGLGLSLIKFVLEAHHGRIWVQSREGQGSTFFVELPLM